MVVDRWTQIQKLFESALEIKPEGQLTFLKENCGSDQSLLDEVRLLLEADQNMHSLLMGAAMADPKLEAELSLVGRDIGHYQILEQIGAGAMGEIFLANDVWLNRKVAIKFLPIFNIKNRLSRVRFLREAQAAARLSDPNIVNIFEIAEFESRPYIVMEYLPGESLRKLLGTDDLGPTEALLLCHQICSGVSAAHRAGIIHRDLKPDNIVLDQQGRAKILDFGIAKVTDATEVTGTGATLGTPYYMAPEQVNGGPIDIRADIFALGVLLYTMIDGQSPFVRDNVMASLHAVVHDPIVPLVSADDPSGSIQAVIDRATAKKVDERYPNVEELAKDIEAILLNTNEGKARLLTNRASSQIKSLAILCLKTLGSPDDEFLSFGITEDLIIDLSRNKNLRVTSMRAVLQYRDTHEELTRIGSDLRVTYVLDGSIMRTGGSIRISAQLVTSSDGKSVWAQTWELKADSLPRVKEELSQGIMQALKIDSKQPSTNEEVSSIPTSAEAYEYYLRGKYTYEHKKDTSDLSVASSLYRKALTLEPDLVSARAGLAEILIHTGELERAEEELQLSLDHVRQKELKQDEAFILRLLTKLHTVGNSWDKAYKFGISSLDICRELDNLTGEVAVLGDLISTLLPQGKYDQAILLFDRILEINRVLDDQEKVASALKSIGKLYRQLADYPKAQHYYEEALQLARKQGDHSLESACLGNLGNVHLCRNDLDTAQNHYEQAIDIDNRLNNQTALQAWYSNLAHICEVKTDYPRAMECLKRAKAISKSLNDNRVYSHALCSSSALHLKLGDFDQAKRDALEALEVSSAVGYKAGRCSSLLQMGTAQSHSGAISEATDHLGQAVSLARESGLTRHLAWALASLGEMKYREDDFDDATKLLEEALQLSNRIGDEQVSFRSEGHLLAMEATNDQLDSLKKLRDIQKADSTTTDLWTSLTISRLLGETLVRMGDPVIKQEGKQVLQNLLSKAKVAGIIPEVMRIEQFLSTI